MLSPLANSIFFFRHAEECRALCLNTPNAMNHKPTAKHTYFSAHSNVWVFVVPVLFARRSEYNGMKTVYSTRVFVRFRRIPRHPIPPVNMSIKDMKRG